MADRKMSERETITEAERLSLIGLFTLGARHIAMLESIQEAAAEITQELDMTGKVRDANGHTSDMLWDQRGDPAGSVDELLFRLNIAREATDG